jgi:murein DD-endopeptidase MepM/ murein hydrolase activator NlpD
MLPRLELALEFADEGARRMQSRVVRFALLCIAIVVAALGVFAAMQAGGSGTTPVGSRGVAAATSIAPRESPTATASPSATAGTSATPSPTESPSPSPLLTLAPTESPSPTLLPAPTPTRTPGPTPRPTPSPTPRVPYLPIAGNYTFPIRGCVFAYSHSHHDYPANDIYVKIGCSFVAPTNGVVDEVSLTDGWTRSVNSGANRGGLSISIVGDDGVRYYGSHLSKVEAGIRPGVRVKVGQLLGKTGDSGDARGKSPHLHFGISWPTGPGIWWVRRGEIYPWPYLDAWREGVAKSPAAAVAAKHARVGNGGCSADC